MKATRRLLERYAEIAETFEAAGALDDAISTVELAASVAAVSHSGVYASLRMERLLARIGGTLPPFAPRPAEATGRVLHVVTETYATGGHTRMVWRWIDRDPANAHSVVSTSSDAGVPEGLAAAVRASGGELYAMQKHFTSVTRAQALRELAATVDLVVVHSHAMDPLPTVAFAEAENRPPVVVFNHADHMFWLGASIADVLHCIRPIGAVFGAARGIPEERCVVTTAPVSGGDGNADAEPDQGAHRAALLERLGWPSESVVLFSAGSPWKYRGPSEESLLELVEPVLRAHPKLHLVVAGFAPDATWESAAARSGGRVAVVGPVPALGPYFAAADIYLESRPYGGPGASSEAAAHGLPVLTHAPAPLQASLFCTDARYGATLMIGAGAYRKALTRLVAEPQLRAEWGAAAREAIAATDAQWAAGVQQVTRKAAEAKPISLQELHPDERGTSPRDRLIDECLRFMYQADVGRMAAMADDVERLARSPGLRAAFGDISSVTTNVRRPYRAVVALGNGDPEAWRSVIAEFRRLQRLQVAEQFAIGLRPAEAEAAIPVLEAELVDDSITVEVFVDDAVENLIRERTLELVGPGETGTGRAPIHAYEVVEPKRRSGKSPR
jgi:hypothetical protein